jgi:hypothetical protein
VCAGRHRASGCGAGSIYPSGSRVVR